MNRTVAILLGTLAALPVQAAESATAGSSRDTRTGASWTTRSQEIERGRRIFRQDTFGNQVFWGDALRLHQSIAGRANGGVGPGLSPKSALALGLKVDVNALPADLKNALRRGRVDLDDPATTLALLKLDAVVGVRGFFDPSGQQLRSIGITCALCHSNVDDSFAPGIGRRRDGWAARDLDVGAVIAFAPSVQPFVDLLGLVNPAIDAATSARSSAAGDPASSTPSS